MGELWHAPGARQGNDCAYRAHVRGTRHQPRAADRTDCGRAEKETCEEEAEVGSLCEPIVPEISKSSVVGAAPEGADDQRSAARAVREMFTSIAPRYDLLNHVLSFNVDRMWWRRTARAFRHITSRSDARILDLCCGTGDMTFALRR